MKWNYFMNFQFFVVALPCPAVSRTKTSLSIFIRAMVPVLVDERIKSRKEKSNEEDEHSNDRYGWHLARDGIAAVFRRAHCVGSAKTRCQNRKIRAFPKAIGAKAAHPPSFRRTALSRIALQFGHKMPNRMCVCELVCGATNARGRVVFMFMKFIKYFSPTARLYLYIPIRDALSRNNFACRWRPWTSFFFLALHDSYICASLRRAPRTPQHTWRHLAVVSCSFFSFFLYGLVLVVSRQHRVLSFHAMWWWSWQRVFMAFVRPLGEMSRHSMACGKHTTMHSARRGTEWDRCKVRTKKAKAGKKKKIKTERNRVKILMFESGFGCVHASEHRTMARPRCIFERARHFIRSLCLGWKKKMKNGMRNGNEREKSMIETGNCNDSITTTKNVLPFATQWTSNVEHFTQKRVQWCTPQRRWRRNWIDSRLSSTTRICFVHSANEFGFG